MTPYGLPHSSALDCRPPCWRRGIRPWSKWGLFRGCANGEERLLGKPVFSIPPSTACRVGVNLRRFDLLRSTARDLLGSVKPSWLAKTPEHDRIVRSVLSPAGQNVGRVGSSHCPGEPECHASPEGFAGLPIRGSRVGHGHPGPGPGPGFARGRGQDPRPRFSRGRGRSPVLLGRPR